MRYEDEFVSFAYPKDARVSLEMKLPGDPIPIYGSPVSSSENDFFRCYRLTFNGTTYCLLLSDRTNDFDDGVCFCVPRGGGEILGAPRIAIPLLAV